VSLFSLGYIDPLPYSQVPHAGTFAYTCYRKYTDKTAPLSSDSWKLMHRDLFTVVQNRLFRCFGPCWSSFGAIVSLLGDFLEPLDGLLVLFGRWGLLEASWDLLGASWGSLGASWGPLRDRLVPLGLLWAVHGTLLGCWARLSTVWRRHRSPLLSPSGLVSSWPELSSFSNSSETSAGVGPERF